jgi:hypothetical protein
MTDVDTAPATKTTAANDDEVVARLAIIRKAGLFVDDPETIPDRHHPIPAGMEPVRLLKDYDTTRTTGRKVRCSACAHHQHHNRGFVAEMPDGRPALIGINCGEKHFGDGEWARMHADLRREQDDAYFAARVHPALEQIKATYDRAVALKGAIRSFETNWSCLRLALPDFYALLQTACAKNEGYLDRYVRRMVPAIGRDGRATQREQIDTVRFGRVPAHEAFSAKPALRILDDAVGTLRSAKLKFERGAETKSRREAFAELARGRRLAESLAEQVRGYARNSEIGWWSDAVKFCLAEGVMERLTLKHRELASWDAYSLHNPHATIPRFEPADVAKVEEMVTTWPTGG